MASKDVIKGIVALEVADQVTLDKVGLRIREDLTFEDWQLLGEGIRALGSGYHWWVGDWVNYGDAQFGEKYSQAIDATELDVQTLMNVASVCRKIPISRRVRSLSFSHHVVVQSLEPAVMAEMLKTAAENKASVRDLRDAVRHYKTLQGEIGEAPASNGRAAEPREATATDEPLDTVGELEQLMEENAKLQDALEAITQGELEQQIIKLRQQNDALSGRIQTLLSENNEIVGDRDFWKNTVRDIRKALGVKKTGEIIDAIKALKTTKKKA